MATCLWIYHLYIIKRLTFWYFLKVEFTLLQHFALFSETQEGKKLIPVQFKITTSICICRCHCLLVGQFMSPHRSNLSKITCFLHHSAVCNFITVHQPTRIPNSSSGCCYSLRKKRHLAISWEPSVVS